MILEGSRYEIADVVMVLAGDGEWHATVYYKGFTTPAALNFKYHTLRENERYDTIAYQVYSDPELWWVVAKLNPEVVHPADLTAGLVIRVPV